MDRRPAKGLGRKAGRECTGEGRGAPFARRQAAAPSRPRESAISRAVGPPCSRPARRAQEHRCRPPLSPSLTHSCACGRVRGEEPPRPQCAPRSWRPPPRPCPAGPPAPPRCRAARHSGGGSSPTARRGKERRWRRRERGGGRQRRGPPALGARRRREGIVRRGAGRGGGGRGGARASSLQRTFAPAQRRRRTHSRWPERLAQWRAVVPCCAGRAEGRVAVRRGAFRAETVFVTSARWHGLPRVPPDDLPTDRTQHFRGGRGAQCRWRRRRSPIRRGPGGRRPDLPALPSPDSYARAGARVTSEGSAEGDGLHLRPDTSVSKTAVSYSEGWGGS